LRAQVRVTTKRASFPFARVELESLPERDDSSTGRIWSYQGQSAGVTPPDRTSAAAPLARSRVAGWRYGPGARVAVRGCRPRSSGKQTVPCSRRSRPRIRLEHGAASSCAADLGGPRPRMGQAGLAQIRQRGTPAKGVVAYLDGSGQFLTPVLRRRWAPKGRMPPLPRQLAGGRVIACRCDRAQPGRRALANVNAVELANTVADTLQEVLQATRRGLNRIRARIKL
jgi:hypothetical protein